MKTVAEIEANMAQAIGTEGYHRHGLFRELLLTDGAKQLAEDAECWWLVDVIGSHLATNTRLRKEHFQHWRFVKNSDKPHLVSVTDGNDTAPIVTQEVEYTDFPLDEIGFFVCRDHGMRAWVLMLTREY